MLDIRRIFSTIKNFLSDGQYALLLSFGVLLITGISWYFVDLVVTRELDNEFRVLADNVHDQLEKEIVLYENIVSSLSGFYAASEFVSRDEFQRFVRARKLLERFSAINSVEYVRYVPDSELDAFMREQQEDLPSFAVHPESDAAVHYIVQYVVDRDDEVALRGLDLSSFAAQMRALERARDLATLAYTSATSQVPQERQQNSFLIIYPQYTTHEIPEALSDRRADIVGFQVVSVSAPKLFGTISGRLPRTVGIDFRLSVDGQTLYEDAGEDGIFLDDARFTYEQEIIVGGKTWVFSARSGSNFVSTTIIERQLPNFVLFSGVLLSALIFSVFYLMNRSRRQARELAQRMTSGFNNQKEQILEQNKQLEEALQNVKYLTFRLETAKEAAEMGVWDWDMRGNTVAWDDQMYTLYGITESDFSGAYEEWRDMVHPDDLERVEKELNGAVQEKQKFNSVFRIILPNGEIRYLRASAVVMRDSDGEPERMIGVNYDVTHEQEVDRAKSEFVSLASHQLRTPLSSIKWYAEMLLAGDAGELNDMQCEYLKEIYVGNERMVALVDALLNVSRLDLGTFVVEPKEIEPAKILKEELALFDSEVSKKELEVETTIDPIGVINADPDMLRIIYQNLISNAVKYTPTGGRIAVTLADKSNKNMEFVVTDTGYGIPRQQQDKIFTKLFRADNVREMDTDGTGLGLYILRSIVEQIGGAVRFTSTEGEGTTFTVRIPKKMKQREGDKTLTADMARMI